MPLESVKSLVTSLLDLLPEDSSPIVIVVKPEMPPPTVAKTNGQRPRPKGPVYDPTVVYVLEFSTMLSVIRQETVEAVGQVVAEALQTVLRDAANVHPVIVSRTIFYLLNLLHASHEHAFIRAPVILHNISSFDKAVLERSALPILQGISLCIKEQGPLRKEMTSSPDFWAILTALHSYKETSAKVFDTVESVSVGTISAITADNYESAISLLNDFATAGSIGSVSEQKYDKVARKSKTGKQSKPKSNEVVTRGNKAVSIIYRLTSRVPALIQQSHLERNEEAWVAYWSPVFRALTSQCVNPCREIRHQAFSSLQRSLLSPELTSADHKEWTAIFGEVLFPLIIRLLKPEVYQSDPVGMSETRVQAATLLCKVFLHYLVLLSEWDGMLDLWLKILDIMDRLMNSGQGDNLEEAVPESLKNILLVMSSSGYLVPPSQGSDGGTLWVETWKRLDRFLPNLMPEVFPGEAAKPASATPAAPPSGNESTGQSLEGDVQNKEASKEQTEQPAPPLVSAQ
ncbi:MAG: hypothetical protein M1812_000860 [Candelaria pacifica]|nr:MAG: hypothetical protein M1812_000860 [Candelaria pacifica]